MKKILFLIMPIVLLISCVTKNENEVANGDDVPFLNGQEELSTEMQQNIREQVIGYGWKIFSLHEIDRRTGKIGEKNLLLDKEEDIFQVTERYTFIYHFLSDTLLVEYESIKDTVYFYRGITVTPHGGHITIDYPTGKMTVADNKKKKDMRISSVYKKDDEWYMTAVIPWHDGWANVECKRMNENELSSLQEIYYTEEAAFNYPFFFDSGGVPCLEEQREGLSAEIQQNIREQMIGYGWWVIHKYGMDMQTKTIKERSYMSDIGWEIHGYYWPSSTLLIEYWEFDGFRPKAKDNQHITIDYPTGKVISTGKETSVDNEKKKDMRISSVYKKGNEWYMTAFIPYFDHWAYIECKRMNEGHLSFLQEKLGKK